MLGFLQEGGMGRSSAAVGTFQMEIETAALVCNSTLSFLVCLALAIKADSMCLTILTPSNSIL